MRKLSTLAIAGCLVLATSCGDDSGATDNNGANNGANNGGDNDAAAQKIATLLYDAVSRSIFSTSIINVASFAEDGTEGTVDCIGPTIGYGQVSLDFEDGSTNAGMELTLDMDGCSAMESGDNSPFHYIAEDLSGDDLPETFSLNGKLDAVTFDEDGFAPVGDSIPVVSTYDPTAEPTCIKVHFNNIKVESVGFLPGQMEYSNQEEPHSAEGYTSGTLTAECEGKKLRCELAGGKSPLVALSLETVSSVIKEGSICVFE